MFQHCGLLPDRLVDMGVWVTASLIGAVLDSVGGRGNQMLSLEAIADTFNDAISRAGDGAYDNAPARIAALVGQTAQESAWFRTSTEYGSGQRYAPYIGRTWVQITWEDNYRTFGQWCHDKGLVDTPDYFVRNPATLSEVMWAALGPIWYFGATGILAYADQCSWTAVGGIINRGNAALVPSGNDTRVAACRAAYNHLLANPPAGGGGGVTEPTALQQKLVDFMLGLTGKIKYSQNMATRSQPLETGEGDCSSIIQEVYEQVANLDIGSYTDAQAVRGVSVFDTSVSSYDEAVRRLIPSDVLLFKWPVASGTPYWDHVEMYVGNGQTCGHGGDPLYGPVTKNFKQQWDYATHIIARRYVSTGVETEGEDDFMSNEEAIGYLREIAYSVTRGETNKKTAGDLFGTLEDDQGSALDSLRNIESVLSRLTSTPSVPDTSTETNAPVDTDTATVVIRAQIQAIRTALDTMDSALG